MKTIKIILTGLIALVPGADQNEYVALLVAHDDHTPGIQVKGDEPFMAGGGFDARFVDKPAKGRPPAIPKTAMMKWFKTNDKKPLGPIQKTLLDPKLSDVDRRTVVSRIRLVNITKIEGKRFGSIFRRKPKWTFEIGDQKGQELVLADRLEIEVEVENPTLRVRRGGKVRPLKGVKRVVVSNELAKGVWCCNCGGMRLRHLGQFFRLSEDKSPAQRPMPKADRNLCRGCPGGFWVELVGAKPVRCPGVQFNPRTPPKWDW